MSPMAVNVDRITWWGSVVLVTLLGFYFGLAQNPLGFLMGCLLLLVVVLLNHIRLDRAGATRVVVVDMLTLVVLGSVLLGVAFDVLSPLIRNFDRLVRNSEYCIGALR